jgi:hypothetical protein
MGQWLGQRLAVKLRAGRLAGPLMLHQCACSRIDGCSGFVAYADTFNMMKASMQPMKMAQARISIRR